MSGFETRFGADQDPERIRSTFYGFVAANAAGVDGDAHIRTEIDNRGAHLLVRLWSAQAMDAFLRQLPGGRRRSSRAYG
jgi:hypothetical protein